MGAQVMQAGHVQWVRSGGPPSEEVLQAGMWPWEEVLLEVQWVFPPSEEVLLEGGMLEEGVEAAGLTLPPLAS